ncbi:MAG: hypothetical protein HOV81_26865 [Kofleriaceae bacterium]|nr:hypothetical protein [Kofleriaceae bacterium]
MRVAGVIAAAALLALVAWYLLRERGDTTSSRASAGSSVTATTAHAPPHSPSLPSSADDRNPIVDSTHAAVQEIGRRCFQARAPRAVAPGQPDDTVGRLELTLRIRVAGGTAHVETAEVATSRRLRDDLRDCIVAASRTASWPVSAPDGTHEIVELFRMGDYVAVPGPDSPPSAPPTR